MLPLTQGAGFVGVGRGAWRSRRIPSRARGPAAVAAAAGLAGAVGLAGLYRGMAIGAMGVVAPISALAAVVPFDVGVAARRAAEHAAARRRRRGAGRDRARVARARRHRPARAAGVGLALVAAAGFGFYFALTDVAADDAGAPWTVFVSRGTATAVAIARVPDRAPAAAPRPRAAAARAGRRAASTWPRTCSSSVATTKGLVSIVSVLASLYPVVTVVLARVVLGERTRDRQRVGAAGALAGAALITAG